MSLQASLLASDIRRILREGRVSETSGRLATAIPELYDASPGCDPASWLLHLFREEGREDALLVGVLDLLPRFLEPPDPSDPILARRELRLADTLFTLTGIVPMDTRLSRERFVEVLEGVKKSHLEWRRVAGIVGSTFRLSDWSDPATEALISLGRLTCIHPDEILGIVRDVGSLYNYPQVMKDQFYFRALIYVGQQCARDEDEVSEVWCLVGALVLATTRTWVRDHPLLLDYAVYCMREAAGAAWDKIIDACWYRLAKEDDLLVQQLLTVITAISFEHQAEREGVAVEGAASDIGSPQSLINLQKNFFPSANTWTTIGDRRRGSVIPITRIGQRVASIPLSFAQQRIWFLEKLDPGASAYKLTKVFRFSGSLDPSTLCRCFTELVRRHEILRTIIVWQDEYPSQIIQLPDAFTLPTIDLHALPLEMRKAEIERLLTQERGRSFDLSVRPLMHAVLIATEPSDSLLLLSLHRIISDDWSFEILIRELGIIYSAFVTNSPSPLADLACQYADFVLWQRQWLQGERLEREVAWWRESLKGALPLNMPTDHPYRPVQTFAGDSISFSIDVGLVRDTASLARRYSVTLYMTNLAAFVALLYRYTGQADITVGTVSINRSFREVENVVGPFENSLALRSHLNWNPAFREILERERSTVLGAFAHQDLPFEKVVEEVDPPRDVTRAPIFQVLFALLEKPTQPQRLEGLTISSVLIKETATHLELTLLLSQAESGFSAALEYNADLFDRPTIARMAGHFQVLLADAIARPDTPLSELSLLAGPERSQLLSEWTDTSVSRSRCELVHSCFEVQARRTPDALAVTFEGEECTYVALDERSNRLARHLRRMGVEPEVRVSLCVKRSINMVVGLLGILKAGGAYVPLDPNYPPERNYFILRDAGVGVIVTEEAFLTRLDTAAQIVCLDRDRDVIDKSSPRALTHRIDAENLAYVIYTSGSTGRPKGVQITHRAVVNLLDAMMVRPGFGQNDVIAAITTLSFDISGLEIYLPLIVGARIEIIPRDEVGDGTRLAERLAASGVTVLQATPATWLLLAESTTVGFVGLKGLCGGEALPRSLADALLARGVDLWNVYGPTETAIWSAAARVTQNEELVLLGSPIHNTQFYVVDSNFSPVPIGIPGSLLISGDGLARGYLGRPDLTAERFLPNPFATKPGSRLYYTGDFVRWHAKGEIEFLGRIDHQVKIRGFRIELGEVEAILVQHASVAAAVALLRRDTEETRLVAYLVSVDNPKAVDVSELRDYVADRLPGYMVPTAWVILPQLPLTPNGKVDRSALPAPEDARHMMGNYEPPRSVVEELIAGIWAEVLQLEAVGISDDFFALGGHSLLVAQVMARVQTIFRTEIPAYSLFKAPTLEAFSGIVEMALIEGIEGEEVGGASRDFPLAIGARD